MEAFSLLKFWKSSNTAAAGGLVTPLPAAANTLLAAVSDDDAETGNAGDDGPFFDLEFTGADSDDEEGEEEKSVAELVCVDGDGEEVVEMVEEESEPEDERTDPNLPVSPSSDDILKLLAVESVSEPSSGKPQVFPVSLLRSATRLRILMSGLKKSSKSTQAQAQAQAQDQAEAQTDPKQSQQKRKFFTIKFKPDEVPIVSLFTRDHSSRPANGVVSSFSSSSSISSSSSSSSSSSLKPSGDSDQQPPPPAKEASEEKRNPKDGVQKYIKMVKPLYIRVSKRYGEKIRFSGQLSLGSASPTPEKVTEKSPEKVTEKVPDRSPEKVTEKVPDRSPEKVTEKVPDRSPEKEEAAGKESEKKMPASLGVGLKVMMRKKLAGKTKPAEAGVVHPTAPAPAPAGRQRDDSLIQQQEWIQGAILHCKKSFNSSRDEESEPESVLTRSASDPSHEKTVTEAATVTGCCSGEQNDVVQGR